jgi:hypothetical protein
MVRGTSLGYNASVARGWESKSVEAQIESAEPRSAGKPEVSKSDQRVSLRRRESLEMSRARVLRELEATTNPRHKELLEAALADLDGRLANFD